MSSEFTDNCSKSACVSLKYLVKHSFMWTIIEKKKVSKLCVLFIFSQELDRLQTELKNDYQNLLAAANALHILTTDTSVIVGNCKQKPITYYLDEACRILYAWKIYQMSLAMALQQIDMRKGDSMQQFKNVTITPQELSSSLDEYLLYSTFLFSPKWTMPLSNWTLW